MPVRDGRARTLALRFPSRLQDFLRTSCSSSGGADRLSVAAGGADVCVKTRGEAEGPARHVTPISPHDLTLATWWLTSARRWPTTQPSRATASPVSATAWSSRESSSAPWWYSVLQYDTDLYAADEAWHAAGAGAGSREDQGAQDRTRGAIRGRGSSDGRTPGDRVPRRPCRAQARTCLWARRLGGDRGLPRRRSQRRRH